MKIERLELVIDARANQMPLSPLQKEYLEALQFKKSIVAIVEYYLLQGWIVNFSELYDLMISLLKNGFIKNNEVKTYLQKLEPQEESSFIDKILNLSNSPEPTKVTPKDIPFFRSLDPILRAELLRAAKQTHVSKQIRICRTGSTDRTLYVLLQGEAGVYKAQSDSKRKLLATLSDMSVFGEGGFLLGTPRTADVVSHTECTLLHVPFVPEVDQWIKKDKAKDLQTRFWIFHALYHSDFFKDLPSDCLDALATIGKIVQLPEKRYLFEEGTAGSSAYILIQGEVWISQKGQVIRELRQGNIFGEIALLISNGTRTATAYSKTNCLLLEIPQSDFYALLALNLPLAREIEKLALQRLSRDTKRSEE